MFDHRVEDDQQLAHRGHHRHLGSFARRLQSGVERPNHFVVPDGTDRTHVEGRAHLDPTAPDGAVPLPLPAVAVERGHPDQSRDLLAVQPSQLRPHPRRGGPLAVALGGEHLDQLAPANEQLFQLGLRLFRLRLGLRLDDFENTVKLTMAFVRRCREVLKV